jgi:chemotaxis signal transduction protein/LysM repeat protein
MEYPESGTVDAQSHLKVNTLLRFRVGPFRFSVPAVEVEGIIIPPHLTVIPLNPPHSKGVFMYHQRLASAISLRTKFGLPDNNDENLGQLVLGEVRTGLVGFWVDEVYETVDSTELEWREMPGVIPHDAFESFAVKDNDIVMASTMQKLYDVRAEEMASMLASVRQNFNLPADVPPVAAEGATPGNESDDEDAFGDLVESSRTEAPATAESSVSSENKTVGTIKSAATDASEPVSTIIDISKSRDIGSNSNTARRLEETLSSPGNSARVVRSNPGEDKKTSSIASSSRTPSTQGEARASSYSAARAVQGNRATRVLSRSVSEGDTNRRQFFSGGTYAGSINRMRQERSQAQPTPTNPARDSKEKRSGNGVGYLLIALLLLLVGIGYWLWPNNRNNIVSSEIPSSAATDSLTESTPEVAQNPEPVESGSSLQANREIPASSPIMKQEEPSGVVSYKPDSSEVYRLEGKDVTVTVERNKPEQQVVSESQEVSEQSAQSSERDKTNTQTGYHEFVHVVVKGDTLWAIAKKYLKNPFRYPELARLSEIRNPDLIYPGDTVRIRTREEK